jgi:hypothetical protein
VRLVVPLVVRLDLLGQCMRLNVQDALGHVSPLLMVGSSPWLPHELRHRNRP